MSGRLRGIALAALLLLIGVPLVIRAARVIDRQAELGEIGDAVARGDWSAVLAFDEGALGQDEEGRLAAQYRCYALLARARRDECAQLLAAMLRDPAGRDWIPEPLLAGVAIGFLRDSGHRSEAAELARRAAREHPHDARLLQFELMTRSEIEGEDAVFADFERRIAAQRDDSALRAVLALGHRRRGDQRAALGALGDRGPSAGHPAATRWYEERTRALAALGRLGELERTFASWREKGGDPIELQARHALRLSIAQLPDPRRSWTELLRAALDHGEALRDPVLRRQLYERLIAHRLADGDREAALEAYDEAHRLGVRIEATTREQIEGGAFRADAPGEPAVGALAFQLRPQDRPARAAATEFRLRVSRGVAAAADAAYEDFVWDGRDVLRVERARAPWPERWVLEDARGRVRASGSAWPSAEASRIVIALREPAVAAAASSGGPRATADGRRRVFTLVLDCGDWRLVQYLRARRELPTLERFLSRGQRAVLTSDPPLTAAAMESLVWPERGQHVSVVGLVHRMGSELAGLASVGRNPLSFLAAFLPESTSLFDRVGAGDQVAANMLFTHGMIDAGQHAEVVGPRGARRMARTSRAFRALRPDELERHPALLAQRRARSHVEGIAAKLDGALEVAREGEIDLLMLRIESLDILTHALFGELLGTRQDDGDSNLLAVYRYLDERIAELDAALDADDVLIVMSDHGIRTAMEHESDAIFVAVGGGVPTGRAAGSPDLAGVPRVLASLLGIETAWPDTAIAAWAEVRVARAEPAPK